jgi:hypothetical protein
MRASKHKRKRERQRRRYAQRPQQVERPIVSPTAGIIGELARPAHAIAFAEALSETQHT